MKQILFLIFALLITGLAKAQVTIGSSVPPNSGALLDLKEFKSDATNENTTAFKGLLLPRVNLEAVDQLPPENATFSGDDIHIGLMVYNLIDDETRSLCKGVHIWSGTKWLNISKPNCGATPDCELSIVGRDGVTYYLYCEEFQGTQSEAIGLCGGATNPNKTYHLITEAEYAQIWDQPTKETGQRLFLDSSTYHLSYLGWVTAANINAGTSTIIGVGFPFSGGAPIGGQLTGTRTVRCVRN